MSLLISNPVSNTFDIILFHVDRAETERNKTLHSAEQIQDSFEKYQKRTQEKLEKVSVALTS